MAADRPRARDIGIEIGDLPPGDHDAITDVPGVAVGHVTLIDGDGRLRIGQGPIRTGVTAILPHAGNVFERKVVAATEVINGFGKSLGLPQMAELGEMETPLVLTNTLSAWRAADAVVTYMAAGNPGVYSFNPIVGECNDSFLNDILGRHVTEAHVLAAIETAIAGAVAEGNVGAGTGMSGFGWKGGVGTASRRVRAGNADVTLGALVLTNTGAPQDLRIAGAHVGAALRPPRAASQASPVGSIMMILATDAVASARQLKRVARRAGFGLARTGAIASHGSGDFVIAFSTAERERAGGASLTDRDLTPLFRAAIEATEEAIVNSLLRAETMAGRDGNTRHAIPVEEVARLVRECQPHAAR
ncbi:MAG: P1 family peptidase [Armatimonadota bacterium]